MRSGRCLPQSSSCCPYSTPSPCWPHLPQVAESKALQRDTIQAQRELHLGQLRQLERLVEQVRVLWLFKPGAG